MARSSSAKKPATSSTKSTETKARRAAPRAPAIKSVPEAESTDAKSETLLKRSDLLAAVAARSALPKSDLRAVIELVLEELGGALSAGHDLAVPPLGRVKVQRRKDGEGAEVLTLRLRRKSEAEEPA